jgi:hypothetical protein
MLLLIGKSVTVGYSLPHIAYLGAAMDDFEINEFH